MAIELDVGTPARSAPARGIGSPGASRPRAAVRTLAVLLAALAGADAAATTITFSRLDLEIDATLFPRSDWGQAELRYTGADEIVYFNLNVNGSWQVRDVPLLSPDGAGVEQGQVFSFDLGSAPALPAESATFGLSITPVPTGSIPALSDSASVRPRLATMASAFEDATIPPVPPTPAPLIAGEAVESGRNDRSPYADFPNQECKVNGCAPTMVSNSLRYLKDKQGLEIEDADTTIATWETVLRYTPGRGIPDTTGWFQTKQLFLERKGVEIKTRRVLDVADLVAEIARGNAVELVSNHHAAAAVGIARLRDGRFSIDVVHDTAQGRAGGTVRETITYDPTSNRFRGGSLGFHDQRFRYAVVESVAEPSAVALAGAALVLALVATPMARQGRATSRGA